MIEPIEQATSPTVPRVVTIIPPKWIIILLAIGLIIHWLIPTRELMDLRSYPLAIISCIVGIVTAVWTGSIFRRRGTEIVPASPANKLLLTEGPFRVSRNPIYLGMTLFLLGIAFFIGTLPMFLVAVAFFCLINFIFIPFEEAKMERQFGREYLDFKQRVRKWL